MSRAERSQKSWPSVFSWYGNAMLLDQGDEVRGRVAGQRGFREVRICGKEILRLAIQISEITAASAGDQNLLAGTIGALKNRDAPPAFAGFDRAHKSRGSCSQNDRVEFVDDQR